MPYRNDGPLVQDVKGAHPALCWRSHAPASSTRTAWELRSPPSLMLPPKTTLRVLVMQDRRCAVQARARVAPGRAKVVAAPAVAGSAGIRAWFVGCVMQPLKWRRWRAWAEAAWEACCAGADRHVKCAAKQQCTPSTRPLAGGTVARSACGCDGNHAPGLRGPRGAVGLLALASCRFTSRKQNWAVAEHVDRVQGADRGASAGMSRLWIWSLVKSRYCVAVELAPRCRRHCTCRPPRACRRERLVAGVSSRACRRGHVVAGVSSGAFSWRRTSRGQRGVVDVSVGMPCRRR